MWTRREQHQAYRFLNRRIVSAVLSGEPETNELPMRRFGIGLFGGIVVGLLVIAGFTAYGLLVPGGGKPTENAIILERETGAIYLYIEGQLHPVANFTSARLILGADSPETKTLSQASLRDVPRGRPVGITDAPSSLPGKDALVGLPWSVCTAERSPDTVEVATHVLVGFAPPAGRAMSPTEGLIVTTTGADRHLIWADRRLRIPTAEALAALGWAGVRPAVVATPFLDTVPAGPDITPLQVARAGERAPHTVAGRDTTIGQMFRAADEYYVMLPEGLSAVGRLTGRLWQNTDHHVTDVEVADVAPLLAAEVFAEPPGLPADVPTAIGADDRYAMACAVYHGGTEVERPVAVEVYDGMVDGISHLGPAADPSGALADRVTLPGGRAALVRTLVPAGSTAPGTTYVVTDQGIRYPLDGEDIAVVQASLGYGGVEPPPVPVAMLELLRTGPALDPDDAAAFSEPAEPAPPGRPAPDATGA